MPKYSARSGGNSAVERKTVKRNDRRFSVPVQHIFALALRADDCEIRGSVARKEFNRDQF